MKSLVAVASFLSVLLIAPNLGCTKKPSLEEPASSPEQQTSPSTTKDTPPSPSGQPQSQDKPNATQVTVAKELQTSCVSLQFQPQSKTYRKQRSLIKLAHKDVNTKSICVRVNGTPVAYHPVKGKPDQILLEPIHRRNPKLNVQYCLRGIKCVQKCKIPRDEFMDSLTGDKKAPQKARLAEWDLDGKIKDEGDVVANLDSMIKKELIEMNRRPASAKIFQGWIQKSQKPACKKKES